LQAFALSHFALLLRDARKVKEKGDTAEPDAGTDGDAKDEKKPDAKRSKKCKLSNSPAAVARRKVLEVAEADTHVYSPATDAELHRALSRTASPRSMQTGCG
jgi:hypothetical protein